jgi:uncharacterized protein YkwD
VCAVSTGGFISSAAEQQDVEEFKIDENGLCPELEKKIVTLLNKKLEKKQIEGKDGKREKRKPLKVKRVLREAARARAKEMFDNEYLGSWRANGDNWQTIFDEKKYALKNIKSLKESPRYKYSTGYEINMMTAEEVVDDMENEGTNVDDAYDYIGVGFYGETENGAYLTFVDIILARL